MIHTHYAQKGFSAIELLITLFVAATFLAAGYQLFTLIITDGGETQAETIASNRAYEYLRMHSPDATNPCTLSTPVDNESITIDGTASASATVSITCPNANTLTLSKVESEITYSIGGTPHIVRHATYVDTSKSASTGLVGWWKLNGNSVNAVGADMGTIYGGVQPTTNKDGAPNMAYAFDGSTGYIDVGQISEIGDIVNDATLSVWLNIQDSSATKTIFSATRLNSANGIAGHVIGDSLRFTTNGVKDYSASTPLTVGTWYHTAMVIDEDNTVYFYINGALQETITHTQSGVANSDDSFYIGAGTANGSSAPHSSFHGSLDDIRVYSRALSGSEIVQLYNEGPS